MTKPKNRTSHKTVRRQRALDNLLSGDGNHYISRTKEIATLKERVDGSHYTNRDKEIAILKERVGFGVGIVRTKKKRVRKD